MDLLLDALPEIAGEVFTSGPMAYNQPWTALINHYSERFADHAAAIAHHVCYLTTGHAAQPVHCVSWVGTALPRPLLMLIPCCLPWWQPWIPFPSVMTVGFRSRWRSTV
jgi:hypothetical protein